MNIFHLITFDIFNKPEINLDLDDVLAQASETQKNLKAIVEDRTKGVFNLENRVTEIRLEQDVLVKEAERAGRIATRFDELLK